VSRQLFAGVQKTKIENENEAHFSESPTFKREIIEQE
jgi:hypothetical protein